MNFEPNFKRPESLPMPDPERDGCRLEVDVPIPMRDGTRLAADLYFPAEPGVYPVLLERTPYGKHQSVMVNIGAPAFLARHGYVVAVQDTRGVYASEGEWYPFRDEAWGERRDGYDTVEWLAAQPYSTGKIGTFGGSFAGFNQYTMAGAMPPHLAATFPRQAPSSLRRSWVYRGGAMEFAFMVPRYARRMSVEALRNRFAQYTRMASGSQMDIERNWPLPSHPLFSHPFGWIQDYVARQEDESYWRQWDISLHHAAFHRPSYHVASWFDIFLGGTLENFTGMRACAKSAAVRRSHKLIIGPWIHGPFMYKAPQGRTAGEMDFGDEALWDYPGTMLRWFDCWLKGEANGIADEPDVRYFLMGANQWKTASDWPPPGSRVRNLYLRTEESGSTRSLHDGSLSFEPPAGDERPLRFTHDPADPAPSVGGNTLFNLAERVIGEAENWEDLNAQAGSRDQRLIDGRCLTFSSAPLARDVEVTGPVKAHLYFSSSAVDTDFVVRLCDVYPDGRVMLLCDGIARARYRESDFRPTLLEPGRIYLLDVDLWATGNLFRSGHRIRVLVNSSCFPRFDVNPGTGQSALRSAERVRAENRVYVDAQRPSHIVLPIMDGDAE